MTKLTARARAREVRTAREVELKARAKRQEDALALWFEGEVLHEQARDLQCQAVAALVEQGETTRSIADLVAAAPGDITKLRRAARAAGARSDTQPATEATDSDGQPDTSRVAS